MKVWLVAIGMVIVLIGFGYVWYSSYINNGESAIQKDVLAYVIKQPAHMPIIEVKAGYNWFEGYFNTTVRYESGYIEIYRETNGKIELVGTTHTPAP